MKYSQMLSFSEIDPLFDEMEKSISVAYGRL